MEQPFRYKGILLDALSKKEENSGENPNRFNVKRTRKREDINIRVSSFTTRLCFLFVLAIKQTKLELTHVSFCEVANRQEPTKRVNTVQGL
jgi:hypothetical protein